MNNIERDENLIKSDLTSLRRWRAVFPGLIILLAGIVIGGASMLILAPKKLIGPPRAPEFASGRMVGQLQHELHLSPEQAKKIKPILKQHMEALDKIRLDARQQIDGALEQMNKEILGILNDWQKRMWETRLRHLQSPLRGGGPRWGDGGGGPRSRRGPQEPFRRGPQEPFRRGPQEPFRRGQPESFHRGPGQFGPPLPPEVSNLPPEDMNRGTIEANEPPLREDL